MSEKKQGDGEEGEEGPGAGEESTDAQKCVTYRKVWKFFFHDLTMEDMRVLAVTVTAIVIGMIVTLCVAGYALFWAGYGYGKDMSATEINLLERRLEGKDDSDGPTIETAKPLNLSYKEFLDKLNKARREDAIAQSELAVSTVFNESRDKRVHWDCVILKKNSTEKWYMMGLSPTTEPKDQVFAQFDRDDFMSFEEGDTKTIEGLLKRADEDDILLEPCRFGSRSE